MVLTEEMRRFIDALRVRMTQENALDSFIEEFLPDDEDAAEAAFSLYWGQNQAVRVYRTAEPARRTATQSTSPADQDMFAAPYRFVPLNDRIALPEETIQKAWQEGSLHSRPLGQGFSGRLGLRIVFDGAMLVGQPEPGKDATSISSPAKLGNDLVIPGSTLRGLARATLETAAFARLTQINRHRRFGIRDFEHDLFSADARKVVRAGWLRKVRPEDLLSAHHVIEPCPWYRVRIRDLKPDFDTAARHHAWLKWDLMRHYREFGMMRGNRIEFDKTVTFTAPGIGEDGALVTLSDSGAQGVLVFSDKVPAIAPAGLSGAEKAILKDRNTSASDKAALEIKALEAQHTGNLKEGSKRTEAIFGNTGGSAIPVPAAVWETFLDSNTRASAHKRKAIGNWAILCPTLEDGQRIPVFWVANEAGEVLDFGLVRVFKRAHQATVGDVLARTANGAHLHNPDDPDYCPDFVEGLFGYVHESEDTELSNAHQHPQRHLKSRLSFGFARLAMGCLAKETDAIRTVQAAPKPSYAPFYLAANGRKDWSAPGTELAGRKVYPPRNAGIDAVRESLSRFAQDAGNRRDENRTGSELRLLVPAKAGESLIFEGDILLHNITAAELGGLIWALTLGGKARLRHMIGRARTAGAGQATIEVSTPAVTGIDGSGITPDQARAAFVAHMTAKVPNWQNSEPISALLRSADPAHWQGASLAYLALGDHRTLRKQAYEGRPPKRYLGA